MRHATSRLFSMPDSRLRELAEVLHVYCLQSGCLHIYDESVDRSEYHPVFSLPFPSRCFHFPDTISIDTRLSTMIKIQSDFKDLPKTIIHDSNAAKDTTRDVNYYQEKYRRTKRIKM